MSSPGLSGGTPKPADLFKDLWRQLGECHQNALEELEAKVSKLKKERCLDAQRLEVFYNRNQQLKEQNKTLQETISLLEERLHAGECDRCAILGENLKNVQDENLRLIAKLENKRNSLEDENRKLQTELQKLTMSRSELQRASSPEQEDGIIPDSPILPSSLPVTNRLKKRKNIDKMKHVRYAEMPRPQANSTLFSELNKEPADAAKNPGGAEVLVPNTCELETSQISNDGNLNLEEPVAETCALELLDKPHVNVETAAGQRSSSNFPWKNDTCLNDISSSALRPHRPSRSASLIRSPDSTTERSPSPLPRVKRFSEEGSVNAAKRKKEESEPEVREEDKQRIQERDKQRDGKQSQHDPIKRNSAPLSSQSYKRELLDVKVQFSQNGSSNQKPNASCISPAFKKPSVRVGTSKDGGVMKRNPLQDLNASHAQREEEEDGGRKYKVEPAWSLNPALDLSMYDSEWRGDEGEQQYHEELVDTDCTWVSHSLLQRRAENSPDRRDGLGEKANDSLDMMFDTTAYGEYKSYNSSHLGQSQPCDEDEDDDDDEEREKEEDAEQDPHENTMSQIKERKARLWLLKWELRSRTHTVSEVLAMLHGETIASSLCLQDQLGGKSGALVSAAGTRLQELQATVNNKAKNMASVRFFQTTQGFRTLRFLQPTFAHVAVVRKKDERRKLKGTTCKECEIYYAHLPEEEKQKKLSACSRHRFLYIPPCTPENFWEVGFPSTQTCIERGYIKEEKTPQARPRRRQPFNALFSPKRNQQDN